ncbi:large subunit ribosomal protein L7A [Clostridium collagenovorans DSM 3089]|uniref:Large subunit ribosomal protein L7A n=1 Tax=Clostridium collagenovorans DSM 3089 TaxID=1121306 RepID=A0A1M5YMG6_9CLOT|nr:ribosomal L7Ae/L30e/S12e/Gadd45 family protein [Clostridium collagenovorans]SHI13130.1 large subunit ribosomal protein L7A [Clostridium collagenovorans DSM 3089]
MFNELKNHKVIGVKQTIKTLKGLCGDEEIIVYVADDAENSVLSSLLKVTEELNIEVQRVATMKELGELCGIDVGAAAALLFKQ